MHALLITENILEILILNYYCIVSLSQSPTVLCDARNNALKERELWSCIVIRRSIHLVKVLSKPCVITVQQFLTMLKM